MFAPMVGNFAPLLGPANQMSYDTVQFYNNALAIVTGNFVAALSFRMLPPLPAGLPTQRLLTLTLRDLRRLAARAVQRSRDNWEGHIYSRLAALPDEATPLQETQLVAALSVGTEIVHLLWMTPPLGFERELDSALGALAEGHGGIASSRLAAFDRRLASIPDSDARISLALRARSRILVILDALVEHHSYFEEGVTG
jgi:uncharacterized membrane protein YccC